MTNTPHLKELASQMRDAIRRSDAARLRSLLEQGAPPDGWWNPVESEERDRQLKQMTMEHIEDSDLPEDLEQEFEAVLGEAFEYGGPWSHDIPLHLAADVGAVDCIHALLEAGAEINKRDATGRTALFSATTPDVVRVLIDAGIDVRAVSRFGKDAFQDILSDPIEPEDDPAQAESDMALCKAMLDAGVPLLFRCRGNSRLYDAAFAENLHGVRLLLNAGHPIDANTGHNALHAICWHWDYSDARDENTRAIVRTLLDAGLGPNSSGEGGNTPLHEALTGDGSNLVAAEELLAAGADVNATNDDGQTPLHLTYETLFEYERVVPFMLEHGANPLLSDKWGQTVIDIAQRMIAGEHPRWRIEQCAPQGGPPCDWKDPATPGDAEYKAMKLLKEAAKRFR